MRPGTGAPPPRLLAPTRWDHGGDLSPPPFFCPPFFCHEPEWRQTRSSEPVDIRPPDLRYRNRSDIGGRIDAPEDGRAPGAIACSNAPGQPPPSFTTPFFCHPFFCHEPEWGQARSSEWTFARRICVIETGPTSVVGLMRPGTGALPPRLLLQRAGTTATIFHPPFFCHPFFCHPFSDQSSFQPIICRAGQELLQRDALSTNDQWGATFRSAP